jgi:hypothetical protein
LRTLTAALFATALLGAACAPAATTPSPSPTRTQERSVVFEADLRTTNEVPPIANAEAPGSGNATITFDLNRDSGGALTGATARFEIVLRGFPTTTSITLAHIHQGAAGANGSVRVDTGLRAAEPTVLSTGGTTITRSGINVEAALAQDIVNNPSGYYFNVHSQTNPGGVVRGQLTKRP